MSARLRRWQTGFLLAGLTVIVAAAFLVPLPYFVEAPGRLLTLGGCVDVRAEDAVPVRGDYLLTSVSLRRATPSDLVRVAIDDAARLRSDERVVRRDVRDAAHFEAQRRVFSRSAQSAAALGLQAAGFGADPDRLIGDGAVVTGVLDGSPAAGVLQRGDVITALDGMPIMSDAELRAYLDDTEPIAVRYVRDGRQQEAEIQPVELVVGGDERVVFGLQLETLNSRVDLPVPVDVTSGRIGGPSAGLMIALAVYDQSDPVVDLAAGRRIAGTGTLTSQGAVGRVGGVDLKALAAYHRGADVFLVPESQAEEVAQRLGPVRGFSIIPVNTFDGAVQALRESADPDGPQGPLSPVECPYRPTT